MLERIKTGVPGLDELLQGGFPRGSNILLIGPPGVGKSVFVQQFIGEGCKEGQKTIYIAIDDSPDEIRENMRLLGYDVDEFMKKRLLNFIDAYSWRLGIESKEPYSVDSLVNLSRLSIEAERAKEDLKISATQPPARLVLDSISTLIMYVDFNLIFKFLQIVSARSKASGVTSLYTIEAGVHEERIITSLNYIMDGVIEFKMDEEARYLRIVKMRATFHSRTWVKFELTPKGIVVVR